MSYAVVWRTSQITGRLKEEWIERYGAQEQAYRERSLDQQDISGLPPGSVFDEQLDLDEARDRRTRRVLYWTVPETHPNAKEAQRDMDWILSYHANAEQGLEQAYHMRQQRLQAFGYSVQAVQEVTLNLTPPPWPRTDQAEE